MNGPLSAGAPVLKGISDMEDSVSQISGVLGSDLKAITVTTVTNPLMSSP